MVVYSTTGMLVMILYCPTMGTMDCMYGVYHYSVGPVGRQLPASFDNFRQNCKELMI